MALNTRICPHIPLFCASASKFLSLIQVKEWCCLLIVVHTVQPPWEEKGRRYTYMAKGDYLRKLVNITYSKRQILWIFYIKFYQLFSQVLRFLGYISVFPVTTGNSSNSSSTTVYYRFPIFQKFHCHFLQPAQFPCCFSSLHQPQTQNECNMF